MVLASIVGYWLGDWGNTITLSKLKVLTKGKWFFLRAIGSTLIGQGMDTGAFISIAFVGVLPLRELFAMICWQYLFKCGYEVVVFPVTRIVVKKWKEKEGVDVYDD